MRLRAVILPLLLAATLAGCADEPRTAYDRDLADCRRSADRSMGASAAIDPADDHTSNPMVLARREELRGDYQTMVDQCMGHPK